MNVHDCDAPLSRRMIRVGRTLALELENTHPTKILSELHVEAVTFRQDWQDGKPTVRILFADVPSLEPLTSVILNHQTSLFNEDTNTWVETDPANDLLILLTERSAGAPIDLDVHFVMDNKNCWQALGAGKGSDLKIP